MLEKIVPGVLVCVLGSYVHRLNRDGIQVGVKQGKMELNYLQIRPDALAILVETLGPNFPVTVIIGRTGPFQLEVPWRTFHFAFVRIVAHVVSMVASPLSGSNQFAMELQKQKLKPAFLPTDNAICDAEFSV